MKKNGFDKLFLGYIFIFINIRILGFDILPDMIGYIITLQGLQILKSKNEYFRESVKYNYILIGLSILRIYETTRENSMAMSPVIHPITFIYIIANTVISLFFMYNLFMGIKEISEESGRIDLFNKAEELWAFYWKLNIAGLLGMFFVFFPLVGMVYMLVVGIATLVITIQILKFFKKCESNLDS